MKTILELVFGGAEQDSLACECIAQGAFGSVERADGTIAVFFPADRNPEEFTEIAKIFRCSLKSAETKTYDPDLLSTSQPRLYPLRVAQLRVTPVYESFEPETERIERDKNDREEREIYIIPGTGFGTGHHPTTRMLLSLLGELSASKELPNEAWDVGSGSGILAIAFHKLTRGPVTAWEFDELAVTNAIENLRLNGVGQSIRLQASPFPEKCEGQVPFIMANLYSSLLLEFCDRFSESLTKQGQLLISGIMRAQASEVCAEYDSLGWKKKSLHILGDWCAIRYQKR